jgi:rhomboid protease GluP
MRFKFSTWTIILLVPNVLLFLAWLLLNPVSTRDLLLFGVLSKSFVAAGFPYVLITSLFVHSNIIHFMFNIIAFASLARSVYEYYEDKVTLITYILGGLAGSLLTVLVINFQGSDFTSLGASSGIFALAGLLIGGTLKKSRYGTNLPFQLRDIAPSILLALFIGFLPGVPINNYAHIGGLIAGILLGLTFSSTITYKSNRDKVIKKVFFYISLAIFIISFVLLIFNGIRFITGY